MQSFPAAKWVSIVFGAIALWLVFAAVLYLLAMPTKSPDDDGNLAFDAAALVKATSVAVVIALIAWLAALPLSQRAPAVAASLAGLATWLVSSGIFYWIDGTEGFLPFAHSASGILANGQNLKFMPIVIPMLSAISAVMFALTVSVSKRFAKRPPSW